MHARLLLAAAAMVLASTQVDAQNAATYPDRPVRIVASVSAGGGVDTVSRIVAEGLHQKWGQPVLVEDRGGAGGNIGAEAVYTAEPDGYTLLASQPAPITVNKVLFTKLKFDPEKFEPVILMSAFPNVLLVRQAFPAKTAREFLAYAKAHPGQLNYASQGIGNTSHLTAELFSTKAGVKMVHVPYKGTGPALNDIAAGHVDLIFMELSAAMRLASSGKARILATCTDKRIAALPDIPTLEEIGVPGMESGSWNAISAPPKTPKAIVDKINAAINEVLKSPAVQEHFNKLQLGPVGGSPEKMAAFVKQETARWSAVMRAAGVKPR